MSAARPAPTSTRLLLSDVLDRPQLLLRELLWRWGCGGSLLLLAWFEGLRIWSASLPDLRATGFFSLTASSALDDPARAAEVLQGAIALLRPQMERAMLGLAPLAAFCWVAAFAIGRTAVVVHYDRRLPRRPWLLAGCQVFALAGMLAIAALWAASLQAASHILLQSASPNALLYTLVVLLVTVTAALAWGQLANKVQAALALGLCEEISAAQALRRAWQLPDTRLAERARRFRQAARKTRLYILGPVFVISLAPSPFAGPWALVAWYGLLSLLPLAATDAVRLGVFFALLREVREEQVARAALLPGVSPEKIRL